jgi:hypothetical protein
MPVPLNTHVAWIHDQLTWRPARHRLEGTLDATVSQMRRSTGSKIAERILDVHDAIEALFERYPDHE